MRSGSLQRIVIGLGFVLITVVIAVVGYWLAGWSILDALYMVVITIFGVGYGEVRPLNSPGLKVFTILVIVAGTSASVYAVGGFLQLITEGEIQQALGVRRMTRGINTLKDHVIICGFGRIGQVLARELTRASQPFVIIDSNTEQVSLAESLGYLVRLGDATEEEVLLAVGIERARVLTTVLRNDAANVFITLTGRSLNPNLSIIARGEYVSTEKKLRQAGADEVVLPATIGGLQMAHMITHPAAVDFLEEKQSRTLLNEQLAQIEMQLLDLEIVAGSALVGQSISQLEARGKSTFLIVAVRRADGSAISHPPRELILAVGDRVVVLGYRDDMPQLVQRYTLRRELKYRGAQS